jgi:ankyrin repeat protein
MPPVQSLKDIALKKASELLRSSKTKPEDIFSLKIDLILKIDLLIKHRSYQEAYDHVEIAKELIDNISEEELVIQDKNGRTALHIAIQKGYKEIAKVLIDNISEKGLAILDRYGRTALHWAALKGNVEIEEFILAKILPDGVNRISFSQNRFINAYSNSPVYLDKEGICGGFCTDYIRFYKKRAIGSVYEEKEILGSSFLYKQSLRNYVRIPDGLNSEKTSSDKDLYSFARRVMFYQAYFQQYHAIRQGPIKNLSFVGLFKDSKYLRINLKGSDFYHAIVAIKLCNKDGDLLQYRLFDPNFGEYRDIKTEQDLDVVFKHLLTEYKDNKYHSYAISEFEKHLENLGISLQGNKMIFDFFDNVKDLMKLTPEELRALLKSAPLVAKEYIANYIPDTLEAMNRILEVAPEEVCSTGGGVFSVLQFAQRHKSEEIKEKILSNRVYLSQSGGQYDDTALYLAVEKGDLEMVKALIANMLQEDLAKQDQYGHTALHWAVEEGDREIVKALIAKMRKKSLAKQDQYGDAALHWAVEKGDREMVKALIAKMRKKSLAKQNKNGHTALHWAVEKGDREMVKALIANMLQEDLARQTKDGNTALHWAVEKGDREMVKALIANMLQEDLARQTKDGNTALHWAVEKGDPEIVKALIANMLQEDLARQDKNGHTALHWASIKSDSEIVKALIAKMPKKVDDLIIILSSEYVLPEWKNKILVELFEHKQWHDLGIIISSEYVLPEWREKALSNILETGNLVRFITDVLSKDALLIKGISKEFFNNNKNNLQEITCVISDEIMPVEFKQQLVDLLIDEKFIKENYQAIYSFTCKRDYYDLDQSLRKKISEALDDYPDHSGGVLETEDYSGDSEVGVQINDCDIESSSALDDYSDYMGGLEVGVQMDDCDIESSSSAAVVPSSSAHDSAVDGVYKAKLTTTATAAPNVYASSSAAAGTAASPDSAKLQEVALAPKDVPQSTAASSATGPSPSAAVVPSSSAHDSAVDHVGEATQPEKDSEADAITTHNKELAGQELVKFFINFYHVLDSANHLYKEEYRYAHYSISNIAIPFMFNKGIQHVTNFNPYIGTAIYAISLMPKYQKQDLLCPIIGNLSEEWCSDWNTQEKTFAIRAFDTSAALVLSAAISFGMHVAGQVLARIPHIDEYGQTLEKANLAIGFVASVLSIATEASYYLYQEVETQTNDNVPLLVGDTSSHDEI